MAWSLFKIFSKGKEDNEVANDISVAPKGDDKKEQNQIDRPEKLRQQEKLLEQQKHLQQEKLQHEMSQQEKLRQQKELQQQEVLRLQKKLKQQQSLRKQKEARKEIKKEAYLELQEESKEFLQELKSFGLELDSIADLESLSDNYDFAIPVLLSNLNKNYSNRLLAIIIRALTIPAAEGIANQKLLEMFKTVENDKLRWIIGNALATVASENDIEQLLDILTEPSYGKARNMLVHAVARLQKTEAVPTLVDCLNDNDLVAQSAIALGNLKATGAKKALKKIRHEDSGVMNQVNDALKKIDEASE
ncbi:MAG: hypothetical protein HWE27_03055 [Gammaproteobacteria bacterium]|nr:hypothetical protein [Gammaproteobacteria bacterium]